MANTLVGVNPTRISQITLDCLRTMPIPMSAFTTDFSPDIAQAGDTVVTRYVTNPVTQDFNSSKAVGNNSTTAVSTFLYHYVGVALGFTDKESSLSDIRLAQMFIQPALTALFVNVVGNVFNLISGSAFPNFTVCNAANFNANNVANIAGNMTAANIVLNNRHLVISPAMAKTLKTDQSIQAAYAYGGNQAITTGIIPQVYGFQVHEFNGTIPTNSNNLIGFALNPQALVIASRQAAIPQNWAGQVETITEPVSGLTLQYRNWYDGTLQRTEIGMIYGAQVGNPGQMWRIQSS